MPSRPYRATCNGLVRSEPFDIKAVARNDSMAKSKMRRVVVHIVEVDQDDQVPFRGASDDAEACQRRKEE